MSLEDNLLDHWICGSLDTNFTYSVLMVAEWLQGNQRVNGAHELDSDDTKRCTQRASADKSFHRKQWNAK